MIHVRQALPAILLLSALAGVAGLSGCADAPTGPTAHQTSAISRDGGPPDLPCDGGWVMADGRWVCVP
jgi:hypothetical protein